MGNANPNRVDRGDTQGDTRGAQTANRATPHEAIDGAANYGLEREHWWYQGLRDVLTRVLMRPQYKALRGGRVLDAGCGSGENLRLLRDLLAPRYLGGFDLSPRAVAHARATLPGADIYAGDLCCPDIHVEELDLVLCCDVCTAAAGSSAKIRGACRTGLGRLRQRLRPGGLLVLHEPAGAWLYSGHDVAVGNRQRFSAGQLGRLLHDLDLKVEFLSYRVCTLLPVIVAARLPSLLRLPAACEATSDVRPCARPLNRALAALLAVENRLLAAGWRWPWGSSLLAVGRA